MIAGMSAGVTIQMAHISTVDVHLLYAHVGLSRYRTQLCNDGSKCRRHICFFAHSLEELRVPSVKPFVPPDALAAATTAAAADLARKTATASAVGSLIHSNVLCMHLVHHVEPLSSGCEKSQQQECYVGHVDM